MKFKLCFLLLVVDASLSAYAQKPEFFREEISFGIDSVFFTVNGDYYFRNNSNEYHSYVIVYPVRSNNTPRPIDTIMVFDRNDMAHPVRVHMKDTLVTFTLNMAPRSVKTIKIVYRQQHTGNEARYILLTTKFWQKPLESASYNLVVNKNVKIDKFSIVPDSAVDFGDTLIYYWKKEKFMPENDFEVRFSLLRY